MVIKEMTVDQLIGCCEDDDIPLKYKDAFEEGLVNRIKDANLTKLQIVRILRMDNRYFDKFLVERFYADDSFHKVICSDTKLKFCILKKI